MDLAAIAATMTAPDVSDIASAAIGITVAVTLAYLGMNVARGFIRKVRGG